MINFITKKQSARLKIILVLKKILIILINYKFVEAFKRNFNATFAYLSFFL